jgi:hypothetical protein
LSNPPTDVPCPHNPTSIDLIIRFEAIGARSMEEDVLDSDDFLVDQAGSQVKRQTGEGKFGTVEEVTFSDGHYA